jgi:hypothetical protein
MSDHQPHDLDDEEINEAGPEASKQASSPLYATETPTLRTLHEDSDLDEIDGADEAD